MDFEKRSLPNGLEVHSTFWDREWLAVEVVVHSGAREDPGDLPGLAHFVEHCVSENIPGFDCEQAHKFFEAVGGNVAFGATGFLKTRYNFIVPADPAILQGALDILGSMLLGEKIEKNIENERKIILREFNISYPYHELLEWELAIRHALYKGHRLEAYNRPLGMLDSIRRVTQGDLQAFYNRHYVPANMSIVTVGGLRPDMVLSVLLASPFNVQLLGNRNPVCTPAAVLPAPNTKGMTVRISDYTSFKVDQGDFAAKWSFPASFPIQSRKVYVCMLRDILMSEVRARRSLTYGVQVTTVHYQDVVEVGISSKVTPDAVHDLGDIVTNCITQVTKRRDLFEHHLKRCILGCKMLDISGKEFAEECTEDLALHQRIITQHEIRDELGKVTFEQMQEASQLLNPERQYTFIAHP